MILFSVLVCQRDKLKKTAQKQDFDMTIPKLESGELHRYKLTQEKQLEQYSIPKREVGGNAEEEKVDKLQNV